jgi:hypothetical protein
LLSRARRIVEEDLGPESPELISILTNYGLYVKGNAESDAALARALHIAESTLGVGHPVTAEVLISYAERLRKSGRKPEARLFEARAKAILDSHPDTHRRKHTVDFLELLGNCERYDPLACR